MESGDPQRSEIVHLFNDGIQGISQGGSSNILSSMAKRTVKDLPTIVPHEIGEFKKSTFRGIANMLK